MARFVRVALALLGLLAPAAGAVQTGVRPADEATMVRIEAGEFLMGSDRSPYGAERPLHAVRLDEFWIDRLEVSNAQYRRCLESGNCSLPASLRLPDLDGDSQPALVPWGDAAAYCAWVEARLPTEAEWEKAARGADGRRWPWGDEFEEGRANLSGEEDDGFKHTAPVGSFPGGASPYGLLDMAGNAAEWVADWYEEGAYRAAGRINPSGPATGLRRVYRSTISNGGGGPEKSRVVARYAGATRSEYGFRCASSSSQGLTAFSELTVDRAPELSGNLPRTAAEKSPLARVVPVALVPATAALGGLSLLWLWQFLSALAVRITKSFATDRVLTWINPNVVDPDYVGFRLLGVRFKLREWISIAIGASVYAASLGYMYLQPDANAPLFLLLTISVNFFVFGARHLTRLVMDRRYGLNTEYKVWYFGALVTAATAWLGNTFGLAGYVAEERKNENEGKTNFLMNLVSFCLFLVFWTLNELRPTVVFQMILLLSLGVTFFSMLPLSPFCGKSVLRWKRWVWWASFAPLTVLYILVKLV